MNTAIIRYLLGHIIKIEGVLMLLPCIIALIYQEKEGYTYALVAGVCILLGSLLTIKKAENNVFYLKEGCITTALCWIALSTLGCIPFILTGEIPSFTNALFETVSGFTTTGSSILTDVEALSHTSLFWRSFTHWIGGMGVLVFMLAVVPLSGASSINLMRAESPGPSVGKFVPKLRHTARILYGIYLALTILQFVLMLLAKAPWFDAICISFGTAGTGGFGILNDSCASYSPTIQWIITIFMILFGVNFSAYYLVLFGQIGKALKLEEVKTFFVIVFLAIFFITLDIQGMFQTTSEAMRHSAFTVASIISTSGFATTNYDLWPNLSKSILVLLTFLGACAGSTGGGFKVSRIVILWKEIKKEFHSYIHPKSVRQITMDDKEIDHTVIRSVNVYLVTYLFIFILSTLLIALEEKDLVTTFTSVATTLNNVGPGLSMVGPVQNFSHFTSLSKWVFIFDMLAGRLELFPLLLLFHPSIWHELIIKRFRSISTKLRNKKH